MSYYEVPRRRGTRRPRKALGCACTPMMGLGSSAMPFPAAAGEIGGIASLTDDLKTLVNSISSRIQDPSFNSTLYDVTRAKIRSGTLADKPMTANEARNFIIGSLRQVADAIVRAKLLSALPVRSAAERTSNHAAQAALIGPAQLMWDSLSTVVKGMHTSPANAASGLGVFGIDDLIVIGLLVAGAAVIVTIVGVAAIAALTYWVDSSDRMQFAATQARTICSRATPPCTAEQYAAIMRSLALGPLDTGLREVGKGIGEGAGNTILYVTGGLAVLGVGYLAYRSYEKKQRAHG